MENCNRYNKCVDEETSKTMSVVDMSSLAADRLYDNYIVNNVCQLKDQVVEKFSGMSNTTILILFVILIACMFMCMDKNVTQAAETTVKTGGALINELMSYFNEPIVMSFSDLN